MNRQIRLKTPYKNIKVKNLSFQYKSPTYIMSISVDQRSGANLKNPVFLQEFAANFLLF